MAAVLFNHGVNIMAGMGHGVLAVAHAAAWARGPWIEA